LTGRGKLPTARPAAGNSCLAFGGLGLQLHVTKQSAEKCLRMPHNRKPTTPPVVFRLAPGGRCRTALAGMQPGFQFAQDLVDATG
jgi:hypothetical protein